MNPSAKRDPIFEMVEHLHADEARSDSGISLAAYESCMSKLSRSFLGGSLGGRYHLGIAGRREIDDQDVCLVEGLMRMSLPAVSALEEKALAACRTLFGGTASDLRPLSGMHAMLCVVGSLTETGDAIWSLEPRNGGHAATASLITRLGRVAGYLPWSDRGPDIESAAAVCRRSRPAMVLIDMGATLMPLPLRDLREAVGPNVTIAYDASHVMGLIAGGVFPNPLSEGADVLFGNTHKSFPGPQKGMIHYADEALADRSRDRIGQAFVSSQHTGETIALYITLLEMLHLGRPYAEAMIANAAALAASLKDLGLGILGCDGRTTRSSTFWVIPPEGAGNQELCRQLMACGIYTNARRFEDRDLIRVGTQYVTRQGMGTEAMAEIACFWGKAVSAKASPSALRSQVSRFVRNFSKVEYSFDSSL